MNVLYLGYWGSRDPLTVATVLPSLEVLASYAEVGQIVYCSIERNSEPGVVTLPKVKHVPISSRDRGNVLLTKFSDYRIVFNVLVDLCRKHSVDLMIGRTSMAGIFGHRLQRKLGIPYIVESFEPHRSYMVESKVWSRYGPRALIQFVHERQQRQSATFLLPVSSNYARKLTDEGVDENRLHILPCCVDTGKFWFDQSIRRSLRAEHGLDDSHIVGIYVGKFGDIYYKEEAFALYRKAFDYFGSRFRLIVLSGHDTVDVILHLQRYSIPAGRVIVKSVPHHAVNGWLCAADFAFCTVRPAPSRKYCSPVKNGEYWACGLPIIIEPDIGDDSDIISREGGGVVVSDGKYDIAFRELEVMLATGRAALAASIRTIALRHRRPELIKETYDSILKSISTDGKALRH